MVLLQLLQKVINQLVSSWVLLRKGTVSVTQDDLH